MKISRRIKPSHLRLVVGIADHEQLGLAADYLAISQPSASRSLAELESLLETELFIRRPKWMEPTEAGKVLIRHGRNVLAELEGLEHAFDTAVHGYSGQVRVGTVTGPAAGTVIPQLAKIHAQYPSIELSVEVAPSVSLIRGLKEGSLDFVVGRLGGEDDPRNYQMIPVTPESVSFCVGEHSPLYNAKRVELRELTSYHWILQERGSPIRIALESAFLNRGIKPPSNVTNASALLAMLSYLANSSAIIPLSDEVYEMLGPNGLGAKIKALPMDEKVVISQAFLIRLSSIRLSRAAAHVFGEIRNACEVN